MSDLSAWLTENNLSQIESLLVENDVDFATLMVLTESDLQELGLSFGLRKRVMAALKKAKPPAPAADEEQRRQLTVLFCDIVGYTLLASKLDPEVLSAIVHSYEDLCAACVSRYEGYVFQRQGDGIVAFFGYPLAHEREAERAIRSGLDILEGVKSLPHPLEVRVGVATGIVIVSSGGRTAVGEALNLASRLQSLAEPGTIAISSSVQKLAGPAFRYRPLGEMDIKGFLKPIPVYRVEGHENGPAIRAGGARRLAHRPRRRTRQPGERLAAGVQHGAGPCGGHQRRAGNWQEPHRRRSLRQRRDTAEPPHPLPVLALPCRNTALSRQRAPWNRSSNSPAASAWMSASTASKAWCAAATSCRSPTCAMSPP